MQVLSRGSLGTLHVAVDSVSGTQVLLRVLPGRLSAIPRLRRRIEEDLDRLARVDHRNVTRLLGRGEREGQLYYALEYPGNATLLELVRRHGPLRGPELLWLGEGLAAGLEALHQAGLVHGNLWPAKVALTRLGPVIVDLSWTPRVRDQETKLEADLEALGATLLYALTGVPPGEDAQLGPLDGVPRPVVALLEGLQAEQPPGAGEVCESFRQALEEVELDGSSLEPLIARLEGLGRGSTPRDESGPIARPPQLSQLTPSDRELLANDSAPAQQFETVTHSDGAAEEAPRRPSSSQVRAVHHLRPGLDVMQERVLGEGGMGVVHLVLDPVLQRRAALKLCRGANQVRLRRFQREVNITARLDHPSIPPVFEAGTTREGEPYLLMRFVDGQSLSEVLKSKPPLERDEDEQRELLHALTRVGEAVAFCHNRRVLHRDLKPANIMIGAFGEVFVMDWGLARDLHESADEDMRARSEEFLDPQRLDITQEGTVLGTPGYMSPEQARGEEIDTRSDVFSLGAILSEILTGSPPFAGPTPLAVLGLNRAGEVEFPGQRYADVDPELDAIARAALAPDPELRYPTAASFVADLRAWLEGRPVSVYDYAPREKVLRWLRAHPTLVSLLTASLILSVGVPLALWRARSRKVAELLDQGTAALTAGEGDEARRVFNLALDVDPDNADASVGLLKADQVREDQTARQREVANRARAAQLIEEGEGCLKRGEIQEARTRFDQAMVLGANEAHEHLVQVEVLLAEREALQREQVKATLARKHEDEGQRLFAAGEYEKAHDAFLIALASGSTTAEPRLRQSELRLREKQEAQRRARDRAKAADLVRRGEQSLEADLTEEARTYFSQALAFDGESKGASDGLLRVDRRIRHAEDVRERSEREARAGREFKAATEAATRARELEDRRADPGEVRAAYFEALAAYDRTLFLVPYHGPIRRERGELARRFARFLTTSGQPDLAAYMLRSGGIDPSDEEGALAGLSDPLLDVQEADIVRIRQAFGGGVVRVQPSQAFDKLRVWLKDELKSRYKVVIQVRSEATGDRPPRVLLTGLWVRVEDSEANTVFPTVRLPVEGSGCVRPVRVTGDGRLLVPWEQSHSLDEEAMIARVEQAVRDAIKSR